MIASDKRRHAEQSGEPLDDKVDEDDLFASSELDTGVVRFSETPHYVNNGTMRDYQIQGLNWLISLYHNDINGILADEMASATTMLPILIYRTVRLCLC